MKKIQINQMELVNGGGPGRTCAIAGGLAFGAAAFEFWPAAFTISAASAFYGCFN